MAYYKLRDKLPAPHEPIAVDTQVIYWVFYADNQYFGSEKPYQIPKYSNFLRDAIENGNKIVVFGGVLLELFKIIEINEYTLYLELNGIDKNELSIKEYRKIDYERKLVQKNLCLAYEQIKQVATISYDAIDETCCDSFISNFTDHKADFVDFSLLQLCTQQSIHHILTDDGDFKTVSTDINIFSGNKIYFESSV